MAEQGKKGVHMAALIPNEKLNNKEGKFFDGNGYEITSDIFDRSLEIPLEDINSKVLSDDLKKKILENFKRRNTEYALSIKAMNKQKHDKSIREEK